jgi:hypothetical protein
MDSRLDMDSRLHMDSSLHMDNRRDMDSSLDMDNPTHKRMHNLRRRVMGNLRMAMHSPHHAAMPNLIVSRRTQIPIRCNRQV